MVSKTLLLFFLLQAIVVLVCSDTATGEKNADKQSKVASKDYYGGGGCHGGGGGYQGRGGGYNHGGRGYQGGGEGGGYQGGGGGYHHGGGGGGYQGGGGGGGYHHRGGSSCYHGCCVHGYEGGCRCCKTPNEVPDLSYLKPHMP